LGIPLGGTKGKALGGLGGLETNILFIQFLIISSQYLAGSSSSSVPIKTYLNTTPALASSQTIKNSSS